MTAPPITPDPLAPQPDPTVQPAPGPEPIEPIQPPRPQPVGP